ncbi:Death-associated protein kinase 1 [Tritrichomonas musculus]|uniref:Death-associated protein kinase 1 n=1 Tax=Tritrichomonas musculus TaxID=1915356 RepID=A0ABR2GQP5_9EUKA
MVLVYEYDDEHEHLIDFSKLLPKGLSFFTSIFINCREIESVVEFLINHGVDTDFPDQRNVYPLEQAIKINSYQFAHLLIETTRIDFNRLFSYGFNYLHLAANYKEGRIFIDLMELNIIDVNVTDVKGDTPLLIATRSMNINIIQSLFLVDNLDYTHCNKNGEDAIKIALECAKNIRRRNRRISRNAVVPVQITGPIKTKGDYLSLLISILNEK